MQIGMAVYVTKWNAAIFDAIEQRSMAGVKMQIGVLILIFIASITITTTHLIVKRRLLIGWRTWLTKKIVGQWLHKGRHYQITFVTLNDHDNPDGRIAEDIRIATEDAIGLFHSLFYCLMMLGSFTKILWDISGKVIFDFGFGPVPVVGYLVWIAISYSICASMLGWLMGKSMTSATHARQTTEANFRHDLIDIQQNSQAIALIRGEVKEQERLLDSLHAIVDTYALQTSAWKRIQIFSSGYSITSMALPVLVAAPRYIVGAISLGLLIQSVQAFQHMVSALSWPVDNMAQIAKWRTSVERVIGLVSALDNLDDDITVQNSHKIEILQTAEAELKLQDVVLENMEGVKQSLLINEEIKLGERIFISDVSKNSTKLFRAMAGLWPWGSGRIIMPDLETLFFMPPKPYLPSKTLYEAICYPKPTKSFSRARVENLLTKVGQNDLIAELNHAQSWDKQLSNEQLQYLGVVRTLLHQPKWIFIQEALDSMSPEEEIKTFNLLADELPESTILTISHQPATEFLHQRKIAV
jgi:putative ATP-binding cassette transporter